MEGKPIVLIIEDDPNDAFFIKRAFEKIGVPFPAHICPSATNAIRYLLGEGEYQDRQKFPFPSIIVTDIKMPEMDGFEFLKWVRDHPALQVIPTIVMSSSAIPEDVKCAYCLGANAYLQKPAGMDGLAEIFKAFLELWRCCEIPQHGLPSCEELQNREKNPTLRYGSGK